MKTTVVAKAVIRNADGHVLLLRRSKSDLKRPGEWDFPGGGVDEDEDILQAAAREIHEEAGIIVRTSDLRVLYAGTQPWADDDISITRILVFADVADTTVLLSEEHDESRWVDIPTALKDFPHFFYGVGLQYALDHQLLPD